MTAPRLEFSIDSKEWDAAFRAMEVDTEELLAMIAESVGLETVAYLRSLTDEIRPPARVPNTRTTTGPRRAHPGGWADVTSVLAASYGHEVQRRRGEITLLLRNTAEYAAVVEMRDGYFVLRGVADPGGPVEQALRRAVARHAPGWEVRGG